MDTENARGEDASKRSAESAGLSRRSFLQGSIAAGAALDMGAFASGCAPTESTAKGDPKTEEDDTAATQERAVLTPTETRDVDVVVVGAGVGGMAAALQAVEQGLSTVLLEKESVTGGTSSYAEGMFAIDSHWQQEADVDYTTAEVLQKVMEYHHWMADAELTKAFFDASGDTIAWLESKGGVFTGVETLGPSLRTWHTYEGMGAGFTKRLAEACRSQGVDVLVKTAAKQLVIADDGSVSGVIAEAGSDLVQFNARGVILTSGGYADNADMINEYTMHDYDDLTVMGTPERTGDGIQMALEAGADTHVLGTMMMCGGAIKGMSASSQLNVCAGRQPMLWVNEHGERFANEGIVTNFSFTGNAMGLQREVFNVIDAAAMRHITEVGCYNGRGVYIRTGEPMTEFHGEFEKERAAGNPLRQSRHPRGALRSHGHGTRALPRHRGALQRAVRRGGRRRLREESRLPATRERGAVLRVQAGQSVLLHRRWAQGEHEQPGDKHRGQPHRRAVRGRLRRGRPVRLVVRRGQCRRIPTGLDRPRRQNRREASRIPLTPDPLHRRSAVANSGFIIVAASPRTW